MRYFIAMVAIVIAASIMMTVNTVDDSVTTVTEPGRLLYGPELPPIVYLRIGRVQFSHTDEVYDCAVNSVQIGGDIIFHRECIEIVYGAEKAEELVAARGPNAPTPGITHLVR